MPEELNFTVDSALISNLDKLSSEQSITTEQRLLELSDIAHSMASAASVLLRDGLSHTDILAFLSDGITLGEYPISSLNTNVNADTVRKYLSHISLLDMALLSELYVFALEKMGIGICEADFLPTYELPETFTYVRNSLSDEAYDVFSSAFRDPRVRYSQSFKECASMVSEGTVSYCLLPLEERGGVRLPTISELILKNDFKINSVTPVFGPDANADMKYALVSDSFTVHPRKDGDDRYLELRLAQDTNGSLPTVLGVLDYFGLSVYRVNTLASVQDDSAYFTLVIRDCGREFTSLLVYLTLSRADYTSVGMYKNLE